MLENYLKRFNRILIFGLLTLGVLLIRNPLNWGVFGMVGLIFLFKRYEKTYGFNIKEGYYLFFIIAIYLTIFGDNIFKFYYTIPYYDKILHFFTPMFLAMVFYDITKHKGVAVLMALGFGVIFELLEFFTDLYFGTTMQGAYLKGIEESITLMDPLKDTMYDLFINLIGGIIGVSYMRKKYDNR